MHRPPELADHATKHCDFLCSAGSAMQEITHLGHPGLTGVGQKKTAFQQQISSVFDQARELRSGCRIRAAFSIGRCHVIESGHVVQHDGDGVGEIDGGIAITAVQCQNPVADP